MPGIISRLHRMLEHYGLAADCLEIVPDVYVWSWEHRIPEKSRLRQAKSIDFGDGRCLIAMRAELYESMITARKVDTELSGLKVANLDSGAKFIAHLLLREIACVVLKAHDEKYRDQWAFAELPKHLSLATLH